MELSEPEIQRYSRQILLGEVGGKGQMKLRQAKVLLIGAGGLGSPAGLYLADAGVGTIGLVAGKRRQGKGAGAGEDGRQGLAPAGQVRQHARQASR